MSRSFSTVIRLCLIVAIAFTSMAMAQTWISGEHADTTDTVATIVWAMAVPSNTQVRYGQTTNYGNRTNLDPNMVALHTVVITGLKANRLYHYRCLSQDSDGVLVTSLDYTFTMKAGPVSVTISPTTATVNSGGTQQFTAQVLNSSNTSVTWSASAGSIGTSGLFTAPVVTTDQTVMVTAASVADSTKSASATVTVKAAASALSVTPMNLSFSAQQGGSNPAPSPVSITNTGGGTLNFTVTADSWLVVTPTSGTAPGTVQVMPNIAGMSAGVYTGHVTISAAGATNSPAVVTVTVTITSPPQSHTVGLMWNASGDSHVVSYNAYRSNTTGSSYALVASAIGGLAYTDGTVQSGTTYYYVVTAVDDLGQESGYSNEAKAVVP